MVLMILLALAGAALGVFLRPRVLAVAFALGLAAASPPSLLFVARLAGGGDNAAGWAGDIQRMMVPPFASYVVLISAGAGGALFAALLCLLLEEKPTKPFWLPQQGDARRRHRDGRFVRAPDMIEERSIHDRAEARIKAAFER